MTGAALIAVDWGTTNFRAWLLGSAGSVMDRVQQAAGIRQCQQPFPEVLDGAVGPWRQKYPGLPVLMSGMIGSRQGWIEAPYVLCPASAESVAAGVIPVPGAASIHIVPGVACRPLQAAPDVMRGEETQLIGLGIAGGRQLIVMPGTHSKWVMMDKGTIAQFSTYMTGELFAVLRQHSILGALMTEGGTGQGFDAGLTDGFAHGGQGLIRSLFGVRAKGLFGDLAGPDAADYLSGLMIAGELNEALTGGAGEMAARQGVTLVGAGALNALYVRALARKGIAVHPAGEDTAAHGLWRIAVARGLVNGDG